MQRDITTGRFLKGEQLCKIGHDISNPELRAFNRACKICRNYNQNKTRLKKRIMLKMEILLAYEVEKKLNEKKGPN